MEKWMSIGDRRDGLPMFGYPYGKPNLAS